MPSNTERRREAEWLKWTIDRKYCLVVRVVEAVAAPGLAMPSGEVLRLKTGAKLQTISAATGADAVAVLCEAVSLAESLADCNRLCLVRGPAVMDSDKLVFTTSAVQKAQAVAALAALNMISVNSALATWTTAV
jgi:hypothetical protein